MSCDSPRHRLFISEDSGNDVTLPEVTAALNDGERVTWICSTATSAALNQLESMLALKNSHMAALNLLVITRDEHQPFELLTGSMGPERLAACAQQLFDPRTINACVLACPEPNADALATWATPMFPAVEMLPGAAGSPDSSAGVAQSSTAPSASSAPQVAVQVIMQGRQISFDMPANGATLLDGAEDAGIDLPFSCRGGVCSTCRAKLLSGEVSLLENYALEAWELDAGFTLPCQAEPLSPEITLDYDDV